jgi:predicted Zn-ribbon and HTH transcriptional regulator
MTDDSTSRNAEGEESADEDGRASDPEESPHVGGEETPREGEEETPHEGDEEILHERDEETSREPGDDTPTDDQESETNDQPAEQPTLTGNPMAGVESDPDHAEPETRAEPESRDDPGNHVDSDAGESPGGAVGPGVDVPDGTAPQGTVAGEGEQPSPADFVPEDVRKYERFKKMDGARYERVNEFLRDRTYVTAREWAIARLCADFRTETGVEMTKIGENLPRLVPFMNDTYTPQAVNQARHSFEEKVRKSGATFLYGAMSGFSTAEQLDDLMYEITEVAKFLLEVEGVDLSVEEELEAEDRILSVMREVRKQSEQLRHEGATCPECGHEFRAEGDD